MPQISARIEEAAGFISVMDDLRPLDRSIYNASYEVWNRVEMVPPEHRYRILEELDPGAIRSLWKQSVSRYVLPDSKAAEIFANFAMTDDFPTQPGQVGSI